MNRAMVETRLIDYCGGAKNMMIKETVEAIYADCL